MAATATAGGTGEGWRRRNKSSWLPFFFHSLTRAVQQQVKMARLPVPSPARAFAKAERVAVERPGDRALDRDPSCRSFERDWQRESPR
jgi:hypothetical protein